MRVQNKMAVNKTLLPFLNLSNACNSLTPCKNVKYSASHWSSNASKGNALFEGLDGLNAKLWWKEWQRDRLLLRVLRISRQHHSIHAPYSSLPFRCLYHKDKRAKPGKIPINASLCTFCKYPQHCFWVLIIKLPRCINFSNLFLE